MAQHRRSTFWVDTLHNIDIASGGKSETTLMGALSVEDTRGLTLIRMILCHNYSYTVHDSGEGSQLLDIGIGVASREALNATALSDPETATEHPTRGWLYRCRHKMHGFAADQAASDLRDVYRDLRAKRRMETGAVFLSLTNSAQSGAASAINVAGITRCLFMSS